MDMRTMMVALGRKIRTWLEFDYMEYSSDANAQAAYVTDALFDSYTKLASHFDGADGATAYTDPIAGAATFYNNAQLSTASYKFGSASALFDGNNDYITYPDSDSWNFGTGDFTIDFWFRLTSLSTSIIFSQSTDASTRALFFYTNDGTLHFNVITSSTSHETVASGLSISADTWYHVAIVRNGDIFNIYFNGVNSGSQTYSITYPDFTGVLYIGGSLTDSTTDFMHGYIDEFRVSKGIARWTSNFTPPISPYPNALLAYSGSEHTQGSYSLKVEAAQTDSLNKTLTKTFDPVKDLSGKTQIKFDIWGLRTGANIKLGFHDSGGTTTESTPTISTGEEFQTVTVDISAVADADKDAIDSLIITVVNADAANTLYIDNIRYS